MRLCRGVYKKLVIVDESFREQPDIYQCAGATELRTGIAPRLDWRQVSYLRSRSLRVSARAPASNRYRYTPLANTPPSSPRPSQ